MDTSLQTPATTPPRKLVLVRDRLWVALAVGVGAFVFDVFTPRGAGGSVVYVVALFGTIWGRSPRTPLAVAAALTPLVLLGYWLSPSVGLPQSVELVTRAGTLVVLWGAALLLARHARGRSAEWASAEQLRASEARLTLALEAAEMGMWWTDASKNRFGATARANAIHGLGPGTLWTAERAAAAFHDSDRERMRALVLRTAREGGHYNTEYRTVWPDGSVHWVHTAGQAVPGPDGRPSGQLIGTVRDVTARKRAEEALRESEERLRFALESSHAGIWEWEMGSTELHWSAEACRLHGLAPRETPILFDEWMGAVEATDIPRVEQVIAESMKGDFPEYRVEYRVRHPERGEVWVLGLGRVRRAEDGRSPRMLGIVLDITAEKHAEEALRRRAEELSLLMNLVPAAIYVAHDPQCTRITGNRAAARLFEAEGEADFSAGMGATVEETRGPRRFFDARGRALAPAELPMQRAAATNTEVHDVELVARLPSGRSITLLGSATPLRDANGAVRGALGAFMDITERKRAEQRGELLVREFAHRVKNTLAVVQSIAAQTRRSARSAEAFHEDFGARLHALARTHDLLLRERWQAVALRELIEQTLKPYRSEQGLGRVRFEGPPVHIEAHTAISLSMALHELATNAVKHGALSREGGEVSVRWERIQGCGQPIAELIWRERGGPPVGTPARAGFGSRLIQSLAREFGEPIELVFEPEGLECRLRVPLADASAAGVAC